MKTEMTVETFAAETGNTTTGNIIKQHNIDMLKAVLNGDHGAGVKGRLAYNLNFIAQRKLREILKNEVKKDEASIDELAELASEDELAQYFGFDTEPEYSVEQATNWVMHTYVLGMDVAKITEANDIGVKSHPYAWIKELVRTPVGMIKHDAAFAIKQSVQKQRANMALLGLTGTEQIEASLIKFEKKQTEQVLEKVAIKVSIVAPCIDSHYYKNLETDVLCDAIEEMCADLGLNIPALLTEIADKAKDNAREKALRGEYIAEPDSDLMALASGPKNNIGAGHVASLAVH